MLNAALIGAGVIGHDHAKAYANMEGARLCAVADLDEVKGREIADKYGCAWYADAEEMLKAEQIDFVDICLPSFLHEQYALLAAKYKKHILCEKPLTLTLESADRIINAAQEAGVRFMVAQVVRFWPEYVEIKKRYAAGEMGEVKMVYANRLAQHPNWSTWQADPSKSGGGLFDLHLHDIDFLQYMFGDVASVYAAGKASPTGCWNHVMSTLTFKNGVRATAEGIFDMTDGYPFTMTFRLVGERETIDYQMVAGFNLEDVANAKRAAMKYEQGKEPEKLAIVENDAYQNELEYFVDCVANDRPFEVITPEDSRHVIEIICAIKQSLETGKVVELG